MREYERERKRWGKRGTGACGSGADVTRCGPLNKNKNAESPIATFITGREPLATAIFFVFFCLPLATARKVRLYEDTYMAVYTPHISGLKRLVKGVSWSKISR